ncbi:MAG: SDR family NAD(P)-dependent oxidoreductase [Smithellaceae bacterium]|nr:SDR family NAD(P)-dependent oxidoreductase [Smithellaceae bacterium]
MEYYRGKNILITGAFGGFGLCFISQLLDSGASLILCDAPQSAIPIRGRGKSLPVPVSGREKQILSVIWADLSNAEGCNRLYEEYRKLGKGVDIIIHNAGIAFGGEYVDIPPELNEKIINVNLISIMRLNALFLPELIRHRSGHLIYMSSVAGFVATPLAVSYSTSKFGVRSFAMALHGEIRKHGIRTSIVYPFFSKTSILNSQRFGNPQISTLPGFCATSPADVVTCTLKGAKKGRMHICPGFFSKVMWLAVRLHPVISAQRKIQGYSS